LPFVAKQACFALKGGTAINLFVREFPRLSVDIDLVYLPMKGRDEALEKICKALDAISADLKAAFKDVELTEAYKSKRDALRLIVGRNGVLDSQHRLIEFKELFRGTIDACTVHVREVAKEALKRNSAAVIFAHNHPSGVFEPSNADIGITKEATKSLEPV